jgi:hypothetical protein
MAMVNARSWDASESGKVRSGFTIFPDRQFDICAFVSWSSVVLGLKNELPSRNLLGISPRDR